MEFDGVKEKTLVLVKPDAIQRGLIGEIVGRFEKKGLKLVGIKMANVLLIFLLTCKHSWRV